MKADISWSLLWLELFESRKHFWTEKIWWNTPFSHSKLSPLMHHTPNSSAYSLHTHMHAHTHTHTRTHTHTPMETPELASSWLLFCTPYSSPLMQTVQPAFGQSCSLELTASGLLDVHCLGPGCSPAASRSPTQGSLPGPLLAHP